MQELDYDLSLMAQRFDYRAAAFLSALWDVKKKSSHPGRASI